VIHAAGVEPSPVVAGLPVDKDRHGRITVDATMRCLRYPEVWALGDFAVIPGPDGQPYPTLAQHALGEAKALAAYLLGVLNGRPPRPFVYKTKGMMASLDHHKAFAQTFHLRLRDRLTWWIRRTYYLLATPGWGRRLRQSIDWTFSLLFRPDVVKVDLDRELVLLEREGPTGAAQHAKDDSAAHESPTPGR
jgi:NADH dehydrogenase